ncbi:MAG: DUF1992 domain-containing protein [Clostridia bacterium]
MLALELLAERKIAEAVSKGEFAGLPGEGRPLDLEDDALVPEEERMANRILKNAGLAPADLRQQGAKKLALLRAKVEGRYFGKALRKLGG